MTQFELFQRSERATSATPSVDKVRARIDAVLAQLESADALPWTESELQHWSVVLPQMTNWLPPEEAEIARSRFHTELGRLGIRAA